MAESIEYRPPTQSQNPNMFAVSIPNSATFSALVDTATFEQPSTQAAAALLDEWGQARPAVVVATEDEEALIKSFRNLQSVLVTVPAELEVASVVWARSLLVSEAALPLVLARAGVGGKEAAE